MGKNSVRLSKEKGDFVKRLIKEHNMTQVQLAIKMNRAPEDLNPILNGKRTLSVEAAEKIADEFPGEVSAAWLLGLSEHKTVADHFTKVINEMNQEADLLFTGLSSFALLSGYEIIQPKIGGNASLDEMFQEIHSGYVIKKGERSISLSCVDMNRFENEVNDFVELMLKHLFARREEKHG